MHKSGIKLRVPTSLRRSSAGAEARLESEQPGCLCGPRVGSERSLKVDASAQGLELRFGHRCVDAIEPVWVALHGAGVDRDQGFGGKAGGQARPGPLLRARNEIRSQRI